MDIEPMWKCYSCQHIGKAEEFIESENGPKCPRCGQDDCTFPHRMYKCKNCGRVGDQNYWFGEEACLDEDPLSGEGDLPEALPCNGCVEKFEDESFGKELSEDERQLHWAKIGELEDKPAELEEVQVELPSAQP